MSCQVRLTANIEDIDAIKQCLFPTDDYRGGDNWLHQCKISASPTGDIIAIAYERNIVVLTSKCNFESNSLSCFHINHSGCIHKYDKVKALLCLPIVGDENECVTPDWTCILVGFDSGHVRCYTEMCELLFEQQFHAENITTIKCQSQHSPRTDISNDLYPEQIYVQYQSCMCVVCGAQLFPLLRKRRLELLARDNSTSLLLNDHSCGVLSPKKWSFQDQSVINDSIVVGLSLSSAFDHLVTASTCGGFYTKYRSMPPHNTLVLAAGSKPFLGYHYALEGGAQPVLSDVAKAVASKLKSALPLWLTGSKTQPEKQISTTTAVMQPPEPMGCRFGLCDLQRTATDISLSPDRKLAAVCDSLGRVLLIDSHRGIALRVFKGYRDAQCSFMQVTEERKTTKNKLGHKVAVFLNIYSPKKGTFEVFSLQTGARVATFTASKHSRLLYIPYGLMGFTNTTSKSRYICQYTTLLLDNDGQVKEISIPFHFALAEKNNKRARDMHLYRKLRHLIRKSGGDLEQENVFNQVFNICTELQTVELKSQTIEMLLNTKSVPALLSLRCVQYFAENLKDLTGDKENLKVKCEHASALLELYMFVNNNFCADENGENNSNSTTLLSVDEKEMENLQKLLDLQHNNTLCAAPHVSFSDNSDLTAADFLSIFDICSNTYEISLKKTNTIDELVLFRSSELLFKPYITENHHKFAELEIQLNKTGIPTKYLLDMLINYWVNRSLNVPLNLEKEMFNMYQVIYSIVKSAVAKEITSLDYDGAGGGGVSKFWDGVRKILYNSTRPFPALMAAILCKKVAQNIETQLQLGESSTSLDDESMEMLTHENVQWSLLIGKLEDISLLNIILSAKPNAVNASLPKLKFDSIDISLGYVLKKGRGCVTELVAQWLATTGLHPQKIAVNASTCDEQDDDPSSSASDNVDKNENILQQLNLLKTKFPYSLEASSLLANMSWEYALAWQKDILNLENLEAAIVCLDLVQDCQIKQGLYQLVWNTHLKIVTENVCKLINKVGKLPKGRLCRQDTGLSDHQTTLFIDITTKFLDSFIDVAAQASNISYNSNSLRFENVWENGGDGGQPLVELAAQQRQVNYDLLHVHYQLALVLQMMTMFSVKYSKPINNLFDAAIVNLFFTDLQRKCQISFNRYDVKLNSSREHFLFKMISASLDKINVHDVFYAKHVTSMSECVALARFWNLDVDLLKRYQLVQLFSNGHDNLAEELIPAINDRLELGKSMLMIGAKRLRYFLTSSPDLSQNISALSTPLTKYMETLNEDWCAPSTLKNISMLATHTLQCLEEGQNEHKLALLLLEACSTLEGLQS